MNAPVPVYEYKAYAEEVHDGDTYRLRVDLGFWVATSVHVRLRDVDCPELDTHEGLEATIFVRNLLRPVMGADPPTQLRIRTYRTKTDNPIMSFNRWIADVWYDNGDGGTYIDLAETLVNAGLATWRNP